MAGRFQGTKFRAGAFTRRGGGWKGFAVNAPRVPGAGGIFPRIKLRNVTFRLDRHYIKATDQANAAGMKMQAAYVRRTAMQSLKYRATPSLASSPHTPPFIHTRHHTRSLKNIRYEYYAATRQVIIGPVGFARPYHTTVPGIHERGGRVTRVIRYVRQVGSGVVRKRPTRKQVLDGSLQHNRRKRRGQGSKKQRDAYRRHVLSGNVKFGEVTYSATYPKRNFMRRAMMVNKRSGKLLEAYSKGFQRRWR